MSLAKKGKMILLGKKSGAPIQTEQKHAATCMGSLVNLNGVVVHARGTHARDRSPNFPTWEQSAFIYYFKFDIAIMTKFLMINNCLTLCIGYFHVFLVALLLVYDATTMGQDTTYNGDILLKIGNPGFLILL